MEPNQRIQITKDYKVIVGCMTYNHSKYIADALNGFAIQKTNFPFACIVMDDASTDGEPEVIKDWLQKECHMEQAEYYDQELANVIIVPHRTNANCTMAVYFLKRNLYEEGNLKFNLVKDWGEHCQYLALCEGDDYWTDLEKLQIQSDCLDAHPEVDMCAHSYIEKHAVSGEFICYGYFKKKNCVIDTPTVISVEGGVVATDSIVFRSKLCYLVPDFRKNMDYDYTLFIHGSLRGGIYYIHRYMSVYRRFTPGSWTNYLASDKCYHMLFITQRNNMLEILDKETDYKYHICIQQRKLLNLLEKNRKAFEKLKIVSDNRKLFRTLSFHGQLVIICKCLTPRLGHLIIDMFKLFNKNISYV